MSNITENILIDGIYTHIDWPRYKVKEILPDATWYESSWNVSKSVRYEQLDAWDSFPVWTIWVRKVEDFLWTVERGGEQIKIFELVN